MAKIKPRRPEINDSLQITSMMDAFTIILVFLLKSYSTEAIAVQPSEQLQLPFAAAAVAPSLLEEAPATLHEFALVAPACGMQRGAPLLLIH